MLQLNREVCNFGIYKNEPLWLDYDFSSVFCFQASLHKGFTMIQREMQGTDKKFKNLKLPKIGLYSSILLKLVNEASLPPIPTPQPTHTQTLPRVHLCYASPLFDTFSHSCTKISC